MWCGLAQQCVLVTDIDEINCKGVTHKRNHMASRYIEITTKAELVTEQGQVEFLAKVHRAALDNPDLPAAFIAESLAALAEPREYSSPFVPRSVGSDRLP